MLNFRKNDATGAEKPLPSPSEEQYITLDINNIDVSELNPRKSKAAHYTSTKASIKATGLQAILTVTRKPGQERYSLFNGGNTRLSILKELLAEYLHDNDEEKARNIQFQQCIYKPYTNDLDVLVKHMAENEERSDMTFIDKARAVFQIRQLYLQQTGEETISFRQLVDHIHSLGWKRLHFQTMPELSYAYENLQDVLPLALNAGLGRPKIQAIRKNFEYIRIYLDYLLNENNYAYSIDEAEQLYFNTLAEVDDDLEPIDVSDCFKDYLYALSEKLMSFDPALKVNMIEFELEGIKIHGEVKQPLPNDEQSQILVETATVTVPEIPLPKEPKQPSEQQELDTDIAAKSFAEEQLDIEADNEAKDTPTITQPGLSSGLSTIDELNTAFNDLYLKHNYNNKLAGIFEKTNDTPFFTINPGIEHIGTLEGCILSGELAQQYFILHLMSIFILYIDNVYDYSAATEQERSSFEQLAKLWNKYATKYFQHMGVCSTSLVLHKHAQVKELLAVHAFAEKHINLIKDTEEKIIDGV